MVIGIYTRLRCIIIIQGDLKMEYMAEKSTVNCPDRFVLLFFI